MLGSRPEPLVERGDFDDAGTGQSDERHGRGRPGALAEPEVEIFYTFTWGGRKPSQQGRRRPEGRGKPKGKGAPRGKGGKPQDGKAKSYQARPPKKDKAIDPDNPFAAALMGLKDKG